MGFKSKDLRGGVDLLERVVGLERYVADLIARVAAIESKRAKPSPPPKKAPEKKAVAKKPVAKKPVAKAKAPAKKKMATAGRKKG